MTCVRLSSRVLKGCIQRVKIISLSFCHASNDNLHCCYCYSSQFTIPVAYPLSYSVHEQLEGRGKKMLLLVSVENTAKNVVRTRKCLIKSQSYGTFFFRSLLKDWKISTFETPRKKKWLQNVTKVFWCHNWLIKADGHLSQVRRHFMFLSGFTWHLDTRT